MARSAGVLRDRAGLEQAVRALRPRAAASDTALVGLMIAVAALLREESRGGHFRTDFPGPGTVARRSALTLQEALRIADERTAPALRAS
jgi:L-aspartate oxidase